ncbi:MAG: ATP-binding cassette domain-containing protein, partial [Acidimicrobiales bacterium]
YRAGHRVVRELDLTVAAGETIALVGPSGSGKTSLLHALQRFWALDAGTLAAGATPLDAMDQRDARSLFAPVEHDAHLFAGTLRDNVALARPDASDHEIEVALRAAQLHEWVKGLPLGHDTPVGERGSMLSGGQRQRVAVARALLADRPVLLLDEPGAGLDDATATRLIDDAVGGAAGRTVVVVTHRRAEAERIGTVVEIEAGRVVGRRSRADGVPPTED